MSGCGWNVGYVAMWVEQMDRTGGDDGFALGCLGCQGRHVANSTLTVVVHVL